MTYKVSLSRRAELDREQAFDWYCANYSEAYALRWFNGITLAMATLRRNPQRCHMANENDRFQFDVHEMIYGPKKNKHRILFRIDSDLVLVLHIRHSAQRDLSDDDL